MDRLGDRVRLEPWDYRRTIVCFNSWYQWHHVVTDGLMTDNVDTLVTSVMSQVSIVVY